ncbi:hypothetical protein BGM19_01860 [Streptomyces agglomeratus]|uniref:Uncharacterized protein n=1 Tax=Streptomyces agglomeratus TaxID=285458 RepID=A0A1E5PH20_9ACTN|nr:hypothetical protein [Streptomyces agglomeratus]OEJ28817.1 hypothetical protein AS594_34645 [Streptomyces agglomeratus]OEJ49494.1 hypothetical protein BGK72_00310 [Streptomyces agglomeratus]OEJ56952.1 hypothetical protein BGM19_01860 [Streptomyces agglomeratus]
MLNPLLTGFGSKLGDRWGSLLTSPALAFWMGGIIAWVWGHGGLAGPESGWQSLGRAWSRNMGSSLPAAAQALLVVLAVLLVAASTRLGEALTLTVLRLLEGYWPRWMSPVRAHLLALRGRAVDRRAERWRELARRRAHLTPAEYAEFAALNTSRACVPPAPRDRMPTKLGDVLKAAESRPHHRYGMDATVCWPHLWLSLPERAQADVAAARARLDDAARLWLWSLLFAMWATFTWWVLPVAWLGMAIGYRLAVAEAMQYGRLIQASFDLYRKDLYERLGWELPADPSQAYDTGKRLTAYLERGPLLDEASRRPV